MSWVNAFGQEVPRVIAPVRTARDAEHDPLTGAPVAQREATL